MPAIPVFQTSPGAVPSTAGGIPRPNINVPQPIGPEASVAAANQMVGATAITARAGQQLADFGQQFADKYIEAKLNIAAADDTAALSRQLNEAEFASSKIPDRDAATADFNARSQKIQDDYTLSGGNPLVKAHVTARFKQMSELSLASTQKASFNLWSQAERAKLITQVDQYSKLAADADDPRKTELYIQNMRDAIDGRVAGGALHADVAAKMKVDLESNVFLTKISIAMAKDPRLGLEAFRIWGSKLNAQDSANMGRLAADQSNNVAAQTYVADNMPSMGKYGNVTHWGSIIENAAAKTGLNPALIAAVASQESGGDPNAVSSAGAQGPMQFMPSTAAGRGVKNARDPNEAIPAGAEYQKELIDKYGKNEGIMAYNWGSGHLEAWIKAGRPDSGPLSPPAETRKHLAAVLAKEAQFGGATQGIEAWNIQLDQKKMAVYTDQSKSLAERNAIMTQYDRLQSMTNSKYSWQHKQITDRTEELGVKIATGNYPIGAFGEISGQYAAMGDTGMAAVYDTLAKNETAVIDWAKAPPGQEDPRTTRLLASIFPGKGGVFFKDMLTGQREDRKVFREMGAEAHGDVKKGITDNHDPMTMRDDVVKGVQAYMRAGDPMRAQQILDEFQAHVGAHYASKQTPIEMAKSVGELREMIAGGGFTRAQVLQLHEMEKLRAANSELYQKNPLRAGEQYYKGSLGPIEPWSYDMDPVKEQAWWQTRSLQARAVQAQTGQPVLGLEPVEVDDMKGRLDKATLDVRKVTLATKAKFIPEDQRLLVGQALAKGAMGDLYAGALAAYAKGDMDAGDHILRGGNIMYEGGPEGAARVKENDKAFRMINAKLGEARAGLKEIDNGKLIRIQNANIFAYYVSHLGADEAVDPPGEKLNEAITAVAGTPYYKNHSTLLLPAGVDSVTFDKAIMTLTPADMPTLKRDPAGREITLDMIKRYGAYRTIGDGKYEVWLDTADGPRAVPRIDGGYWKLDIKPLVARVSDPTPTGVISP